MVHVVIVVFGATGVQGNSVARALLQHPAYKVKAVTRNVESKKAKELEDLGAEVVYADYDQPDTLTEVLTGAHGAFVVTNFWEYLDQDKEIKQGKVVADAAKVCGVQHFVYSGLESCQESCGIAVAHYDGKAKVEDYIKQIGLPYTFVHYPCYLETIFTLFRPQKTDNDKVVCNIPMEGKELDYVYATKAGKSVCAIFDKKEEYLGVTVGLSSFKGTVAEITEAISKVTGKDIQPGEVTAKQYAGLGFPGAEQLANMFTCFQYDKLNYSVDATHKLDPDMPGVNEWAAENKAQLLALFD